MTTGQLFEPENSDVQADKLTKMTKSHFMDIPVLPAIMKP